MLQANWYHANSMSPHVIVQTKIFLSWKSWPQEPSASPQTTEHLPYVAVCCRQYPVPVNQWPTTEVLAPGALQWHNVFDGVRCSGVTTHYTTLHGRMACMETKVIHMVVVYFSVNVLSHPGDKKSPKWQDEEMLLQWLVIFPSSFHLNYKTVQCTV